MIVVNNIYKWKSFYSQIDKSATFILDCIFDAPGIYWICNGESMTKENLRFYNMIIHLIQNNKLYEENAAIKKVWQKEGTTFFDIYFYRTRKSYVFDSAFIHDLRTTGGKKLLNRRLSRKTDSLLIKNFLNRWRPTWY